MNADLFRDRIRHARANLGLSRDHYVSDRCVPSNLGSYPQSIDIYSTYGPDLLSLFTPSPRLERGAVRNGTQTCGKPLP